MDGVRSALLLIALAVVGVLLLPVGVLAAVSAAPYLDDVFGLKSMTNGVSSFFDILL